MLPQIINRIVEAGISFERVREFLLAEEYQSVGEGELKEDGEMRYGLTMARLYTTQRSQPFRRRMKLRNQKLASGSYDSRIRECWRKPCWIDSGK